MKVVHFRVTGSGPASGSLLTSIDTRIHLKWLLIVLSIQWKFEWTRCTSNTHLSSLGQWQQCSPDCHPMAINYKSSSAPLCRSTRKHPYYLFSPVVFTFIQRSPGALDHDWPVEETQWANWWSLGSLKQMVHCQFCRGEWRDFLREKWLKKESSSPLKGHCHEGVYFWFVHVCSWLFLESQVF